jgi:hypothetical protein
MYRTNSAAGLAPYSILLAADLISMRHCGTMLDKMESRPGSILLRSANAKHFFAISKNKQTKVST